MPIYLSLSQSLSPYFILGNQVKNFKGIEEFETATVENIVKS